MNQDAPSLEVPVPLSTSPYTTADVRALFADLTNQTPRDEEGELAFIASKLHLIRTHPTLDPTTRKTVAANLSSGITAQTLRSFSAPIPGGVGYGMFYDSAARTNWATGTAIYWEIICPTPPGGNVNTYLYLTATNRAGKGVEAFISYNGQSQTFFKVFDWARYPAAPWQTNISFANLASYL